MNRELMCTEEKAWGQRCSCRRRDVEGAGVSSEEQGRERARVGHLGRERVGLSMWARVRVLSSQWEIICL